MQSSYELEGELNEDCTGIIFDHSMYSRVLKDWSGRTLALKISLFDGKRTNQQNRYWHGVMLQVIIEFLKETQGETYSIERAKIWTYTTVLNFEYIEFTIGDRIFQEQTFKRMSQCGKKEFNQRKEKIQMWFAERGWDIPDPPPKYGLLQ